MSDPESSPPRSGTVLTRTRTVLLGYCLLTVVMTYPLVFKLARKLPAHDEDMWIFVWNNWWFRQAVSSLRSFLFTPFLFHPTGASLASHSNSPLFSALAALAYPIAGETAAYNLSTLAIFVIGAWGAYLLVLELTSDSPASFVAGAIYAFAPYHLTQALAHPNLASVEWLPFLALFLHRLLRRGGVSDVLGAAVFFSLSVWSDLHLAVLGGAWAFAFVSWTLLTDPRSRAVRILACLTAAAGAAALLSAPAILPVLRDLSAGGGIQPVLDSMRETGQTDLLAFITPPRLNPIAGPWLEEVYRHFDRNYLWMPYLGAVPALLAAIAIRRRSREASFWLLSGILWLVLALGSTLRLDGVVYPGVPLPFSLLEDRFPFNTLRSADRFNLLVPLSLAVLAGMGLSASSKPRRRRWIAIAASLTLLEYLCAPIPLRSPIDASPFLLEMRKDGESYAVLDLPMGQRPSKRWMYLQTIHGKPMVEGHISRVPPGAYDFIESVPLLRAFQDPAGPAPSDIAAGLCRLSSNGIRYVLIHPRFATAEEIARWTSWLGDSPVSRDEDLIAYATATGCTTGADSER